MQPIFFLTSLLYSISSIFFFVVAGLYCNWKCGGQMSQMAASSCWSICECQSNVRNAYICHGWQPHASEMAKLLDPRNENSSVLKLSTRDDGTQKHQRGGLDAALRPGSAVLVLDDTENGSLVEIMKCFSLIFMIESVIRAIFAPYWVMMSSDGNSCLYIPLLVSGNIWALHSGLTVLSSACSQWDKASVVLTPMPIPYLHSEW